MVRRCAVVLACLGIVAGAGIPAGADAPERTGRTVYVTNGGRAFDGTLGPHVVEAYRVGAGGALTPLGEPVATGPGARGIVFTPDSRHAFVVVLDENAVYGYDVGPAGELLPHGSPAGVGGMSPFGIAIAPNGRTIYTANQGDGTVSALTVGADGTPALLGAPVSTGAVNPRNVAVSPDGRFLFVSHGVPVDDVPDVLITFPIRPDGTLGPARAPVQTGAAGTGIGITPDGRFLYVACSTTDDVYGFRIGADGELTPLPGSPYPAPRTPEGVAVAPDARHLYVTSVATRPVVSPPDSGLWSFAIGRDGALSLVADRIAGSAGPGMTPTPDGRHLYVSNFFGDSVSEFDLGRFSGVPTEIAGSPVSSFGESPSFDGIGVRPNQGPTAAFEARTGRFDATGSADPDGRIARYDWDFGDGTGLPDGGPRPVHAYRQAGRYRVTLVVTDDEGCSTRPVFTGRSWLCTGSVAARATRTVTVR